MCCTLGTDTSLFSGDAQIARTTYSILAARVTGSVRFRSTVSANHVYRACDAMRFDSDSLLFYSGLARTSAARPLTYLRSGLARTSAARPLTYLLLTCDDVMSSWRRRLERMFSKQNHRGRYLENDGPTPLCFSAFGGQIFVSATPSDFSLAFLNK